MKTKTFSAETPEQLDEKINHYTKKYNVVDVKYSSSMSVFAQGANGNIIYYYHYSAMLIIKRRWRLW